MVREKLRKKILGHKLNSKTSEVKLRSKIYLGSKSGVINLAKKFSDFNQILESHLFFLGFNFFWTF